MKKIYSLFFAMMTVALAQAQPTPQIPNGGFETWEGSGSSIEPTNFNSNKTGSSLASIGPQTCFKDPGAHSGSFCVKLVSTYYILAVVNGNLTSGVVNAPSSNKADGYIGTVNYSSASDIRHLTFDGRPDSLVGYYKYTSGGTSGSIAEQGKVRAILHTGEYNDPEVPLAGFGTGHTDYSANKIGDALFLTPTTNVTTWTRFAVPFSYVSGATPTYLMLNMTSSANQLTTVPSSSGTGSQIWLDDIAVVYNTTTAIKEQPALANNAKVYAYDNTLYVDFAVRTAGTAVLKVFDVTGKEVASKVVDSNRLNTIGLQNLNSGLYLYQIQAAGASASGKFILQ